MIPKRPRFRPIALLCALSAALVLYAGCFSSITGDEDVSETVAADGSAGSNESNANANGGAGGSSGNAGGNVGSQESDQGGDDNGGTNPSEDDSGNNGDTTDDDNDEPAEIIYEDAADLADAIRTLVKNPPAAKNVTLKAGGSGFTNEDFQEGAPIQNSLKLLYGTDILVTLDLSGITGVTSIGREAFIYCTNLVAVEIPASVTKIEDDAFRNCRDLASVTIPEGMESIGLSVFYGCTKLASITFTGTAEQWKSIKFASSSWHNTVPETTKVTCTGGGTIEEVDLD